MKKILAVLAVCIILAVPLILSVSAAEATLNFKIVVYDNYPDQVQGDYLKVKFKYTSGGTTYTAGPYSNNAQSVLTGEFFRVICIESSAQNNFGYTGAVVNIFTDSYEDVTGLVLNLTLNNGYFYIPFDQEVSLLNTYGGENLTFQFQAVNWQDFLDQRYGYSAGYDAGKTDGYTQCMQDKYFPLLNQYNYLLQHGYEGASEEQLQRAHDDGFNDGLNAATGQEELIKDTISSTIDATGGVLFQLLSIQFFGIPISYIFAAMLLIPATIFAIKLFMHKG